MAYVPLARMGESKPGIGEFFYDPRRRTCVVLSGEEPIVLEMTRDYDPAIHSGFRWMRTRKERFDALLAAAHRYPSDRKEVADARRELLKA